MTETFYHNSDYEAGYQDAIFDIQNFFCKNSNSIKFFRMFNSKGVMEILRQIANKWDLFLMKKEEFEVSVKAGTPKMTGKELENFIRKTR